MASPEMIAMLQKRRLELLKELQAIDVLLGAQNPTPKTQNPAPYKGRLGYFSTRDEHIALLREKTEAISWKDYTLKALQILGPSRPTAITNLIIDANDHKIPDTRIKTAVTTALSNLVREKKVEIKKDEENQKVFYPI